MKTILLFAFVFIVSRSCSDKEHEQSNTMDLEEVAEFALRKPVKFVIDSLHLNADKLTFIDEPPRIISSVVLDYSNKGTIEIFFERTSIVSDNLNRKEQYLSKIANKVIEEVKWERFDGKKGSVKSIKVY